MTRSQLFLCAGLQSSGTTLISWCFLQRGEMDGILDARCDRFADLSLLSTVPCTWLKTTISSFRVSEQIAYFEDAGWRVNPLLVCRDVRHVYASLRTKPYGSNGTTAEDPPLRLRFRRFREDWEMFVNNRWPIIRFDRFLVDTEVELRSACAKLYLDWDPAMLTWPKSRSDILDARHGNETFNRTRNNDLQSTLQAAQNAKNSVPLVIPASELAWLEDEFAGFNESNGYPAHIEIQPGTAEEAARAIPCFDVSRRFTRRSQPSTLRHLIRRIKIWCKGKPSPLVQASDGP